MKDIDKLRLDSTGDYYNANDVEKLVDSLNKKIEELETCRKCLRVKNCEVCTHNTLKRQDCYSDNFVLDNEKYKNYFTKENKTE